MKRIAVFLICIFLSLLNAGCMGITEKLRSNGDKALEFISEKYQRDFEPITYEMSDYLSNTDTVHCYTDGMDIENEHVEVYILRDGSEVEYVDNYFSFLVRPQAEEFIGDMIESEFDEFKVYCDDDGGALPNELTHESSLEDLYRVKSDYWMDVKVYIKGNANMSETEYHEKIQRIEQQLLDTNHRYTIYIFAVSDEVYQSLERHKQDDFWRFYIGNPTPDGETYYYLYNNIILDGEVR